MTANMASEATSEKNTKEAWPNEVSEYFYRELLFAKHENTILRHIKVMNEARSKRLQVARDRGELQECACCFDDEILPEDQLDCGQGHLFCVECIARSVEAALSEGKASYPCLTGSCEKKYSLRLLQEIVPAKTFSHILRRTQEEELRQANIPDLVTCPFCPYATVMPDDSDKVLRCLNPDCLKESCRLCHEPSHIPLRCDEVEKTGEVKMRTFIENKMAEAMMRTCPECGKKFYKIHGCNKMTCVCGASMCYVCRKPINDYTHFEQNPKCSKGHMDELHNKERHAAAKAAKKEYLQQHPEARDITLKYDPATGLTPSPQRPDLEDADSDDDYFYDSYHRDVYGAEGDEDEDEDDGSDNWFL